MSIEKPNKFFYVQICIYVLCQFAHWYHIPQRQDTSHWAHDKKSVEDIILNPIPRILTLVAFFAVIYLPKSLTEWRHISCINVVTRLPMMQISCLLYGQPYIISASIHGGPQNYWNHFCLVWQSWSWSPINFYGLLIVMILLMYAVLHYL